MVPGGGIEPPARELSIDDIVKLISNINTLHYKEDFV